MFPGLQEYNLITLKSTSQAQNVLTILILDVSAMRTQHFFHVGFKSNFPRFLLSLVIIERVIA